MADIVELFPRRPIGLASERNRTVRRALLLAAAALLALPALYWGNIAWQRHQLQQDLRLRGVRAAEVLDAQGDCYSRRNRYSGAERPIDCWLTITYRLRPQEGGAILTAPAHLDGRMPIFTPPAFYDPADPGRVMLEPEMDRALGWDESFGPAFLLIMPAILLVIFFFTARRGLAKAARDPVPVILPIEKVIRNGNRLYIHIRPPGAARPCVDSFTAPAAPLLVPPPPGAPPGQQWVLALIAPNGRAHALDDRLARLDLSELERVALLGAARH